MTLTPENISFQELVEINKKQESQINHLESQISQMQFQIDQMNRLLFGAKRERFIRNADEAQLTLPFDVKVEEAPEKEQEVISYVRSKNTHREHPGRLPLPSHLPVEEIVIEPKEDTTGLKCIGKEVTDQLELVPAKLYIKRFIRPRYIKPTDETALNHVGIIADLPTFPIEKGIAGPGLLAQIMVDKFVDHLPIYRQIERFKREGIHMPSSTLNGWQESICNLLEPLYDTLKHRVLSQGYLQVDETPIQVLDKTKKGKTHRGYHWIYYSPLEKTVFFDYNNGRSREGPTRLLKNFKGYLQTDGYNVYDIFGKKEHITLLNCMAHARRGFEKALDYDKPKAEYAMDMFQKLYTIEQKARDENLTQQQRHELRLDQSLPILNELGKWIVETYKTELPKSALGKALAYCIPRWDNLLAYLNDGSLEIDNNLAENAIRPIALGRKNYLFAGSERGAERAAMFYSFFGTCKKNNINPFEWLRKVLEVIPNYKVNQLTDLLPQNFKL
ncbi:MAG: IS66 family transposase [Bacteroidota bacterium]|nr:MAG: IS66 family transposase [Bacteroidota bacterium]QQS50528.1 MAG: IS66 family transposase [Bacteroidota bacterium]QQS50745.1 MAG: IS66 family transposase [Bacteroidota bacterium]